MTTEILTQDELKSLLYYNPHFGVFVWTAFRHKGAIKGNIAGCVSDNWYRRIKINGKRYLAHRLVFLYLYGRFPAEQVDHINGIKDDNSRKNLREVSSQQNNRNKARNKNNTSGMTGVYWDKAGGKWRPGISVNKKLLHLGSFDDYSEACSVRKSAEIKYGYHENHGRKQ